MTVANVNVTKVLFKRGNTVQNNNYTGVSGEITIDTQAKTLRIHDGSTVGGNIITATLTGNAGSQQAAIDSLNANVGAYQIYANANAVTQTVSINAVNANLGAFQTFSNANAAAQATSINSINANLGAFQSYANITLSTIANAASQESAINSINANVGAYQTFANANATSQTTEINLLRANITAANSAITSLTSNAAIQAALLDTLTGNAATQSQVLDTLTSNAATQATTLTTLLSNAVAQQTSLIDLVANAATQAQFISNTNANTKSYLSAFDGNIIPAANVTYSLGDATHQWKDLWVSNNTIYIGNTPVRVHNGTLLVNDTAIADTVTKLTNGASTFQLFANGESRSPDTVFASNGVSIINANGAVQGGIYNSGDANWFNIGASTGRGFKFYVDEETEGPLFFANGSVNVPSNLYSVAGVIGDVNMYGGTISGANPGWNYLTLANQIEGYVFVQLPSDATANVANLSIHNDIGNVEIATGDGISYNYWYFRNDGNLTIPGNINYANGVSILSGIGGTVNGNIVVGDSQIQFVANSSGDGYGLSTIRLVPYTAGYDSAIIIIDPTYPNHIHMRAGFEQDNAAANLFLGGEASHFNVEEGANPNVSIRSNYYTWTFGTDGTLTLPGGYTLGEPGGPSIRLQAPNTTDTIQLNWANEVSFTLGNTGAANIAQIGTFGGYWNFDDYGNLTIPGGIIMDAGSSRLISVVTPEPGLISWEFGMDGTLTTPGNIITGNVIFADGTVSTGGVTYAAANASVQMISNNAYNQVRVDDTNVEIYTSVNGVTQQQWTFDNAGTVTFPTGGNLTFDSSAVSTIDGITNISATGTVGANVIQVLDSITSFGASPAPVIYGFRSIATTGSAVNEGNISASGNLVASQNAYVTGNVFAARYNFANGVNILSTVGAGSYGNTQVAEYLPTYSGNASAARVQVTNAVDFMYGGYPYMGWQLSGSDTLKLRTNIASGDYTDDAIIVDRQSLGVNVVATLTAGNIITANGLFWSNGVAYSTGGGASTGNVTFTDTTISTTGGAGQGIILNSAGAGEIAMLDYVGINNTNPGYWLHVGDGAPGAVNNTGNISIDYNNGLDSSRASTIIGYAWWDAGGNGNNNRGIGAHRQFGIYKNDDLYTTKYLEIDLNSGNANLTNISVTRVTTTNGVFWANGTVYSTGGTYGNTEVAAYLPAYTGNIAAGNVNVTNTVYAANIVTSGTSGNISGVNVISANTFVFAANGVNILSAAGGGTYGNTEVAAYLLTWPNIDSNILDATSANITTLRAPNFNSANAVISGGYISALTNASITTATITTLNSTGGNITTLRATNFGTANAVITGGYINSLANLSATTAVFTNLSTGNAVINGGYISALTNAYITTSAITNFSTANAVITGGYASGLANITATGNVTAGNLIGYGSNTSIIAGAYTSTFDNVGNVILPNAYVSGNTTVMGIAPGYAPNRPAFRVYGNGAVPIWHNTANVNLKGSAITVDHNQGNYFDSTTGKFTVPVAGLYMTTLQARVGDNNGLNQIAVLKNGNNSGANVVCFWETDTNTGTATHFGTSGVIVLAPGDFLSANILAGNINFDGNDSWTVTYLG